MGALSAHCHKEKDSTLTLIAVSTICPVNHAEEVKPKSYTSGLHLTRMDVTNVETVSLC